MAIDTTSQRIVSEAGMAVTADEYERIALSDPDVTWELHRGRLREKPEMSFGHADVLTELCVHLYLQLDRNEFRVHVDNGRLRRTTKNYFVPDLIVIPLGMGRDLLDRSDRLEVYTDPLPLVVEVWSPSTGGYDVSTKLPEYQRRGDKEIWRLHPDDRTLTAWRRQADGSYAESHHTGGVVRPVALPNVTIQLEVLFDV